MLTLDVYRGIGQPVYLTVNCLNEKRPVLHELGHLIGLFHEHQRPDRDNYIRVNHNNVAPPFRNEFDKLQVSLVGDYDLKSIMHYQLDAFAINKAIGTMEVLPNVTVPEGFVIGTGDKVTVRDKGKVFSLYDCLNGKYY